MGAASSRDAYLARARGRGASAADPDGAHHHQQPRPPLVRPSAGPRPDELWETRPPPYDSEDGERQTAADALAHAPADSGGGDDGRPLRHLFRRGPISSPVPPPAMFRTDTIKNDVNLKKNTLRLVRDDENPNLYLIEFVFDAAVDGDITVYFCAHETTSLSLDNRLRFEGRYQKKPNKTRFKEGFGQVYRQKRSKALDVTAFRTDELIYNGKSDIFPVIIRLEAAQPSGEGTQDAAAATAGSNATAPPKSRIHSQCSFATLRVVNESAPDPAPAPRYVIELISQKILVGDTTYELQEIYGIQNPVATGSAELPGSQHSEANTQQADMGTTINLDDGAECVICLSDTRDTVVLPCRHLCLCEECALRLRSRSNKCPVCRSRVDSLLQIKEMWTEPTTTGDNLTCGSSEAASCMAGTAAPSSATTGEPDTVGSNMSTTVEPPTSVVSAAATEPLTAISSATAPYLDASSDGEPQTSIAPAPTDSPATDLAAIVEPSTPPVPLPSGSSIPAESRLDGPPATRAAVKPPSPVASTSAEPTIPIVAQLANAP